jgi:hypothetical protein
MANFDSVEYSLVNRIRTLAETKDCTPKNVESLYITSLELKNYSQYIPRNAGTISMTTDLHKMVERLLNLKNKKELTMDDYDYIAKIQKLKK